MLVPDFKLTQQLNHVILTLRLPYCKISASQFYIQQQHFKFYLKPYLLNLKFQQKLKLSEQPERAIYDVDKHLLKIYILKNTPGEEFTNLDVLTQLISSKSGAKKEKQEKEKSKILIQVVGQQNTNTDKQEQENTAVSQFSYGFNNNYTNVFNGLSQQLVQLFSCDPQTTPVSQRLQIAKQQVLADFQLQHYLFDMKENQQIQHILHPLPIKQLQNLSISIDPPLPHQTFLQILKLPKKDLLISKSLIISSLYQIIDILFSYKYQLRCMNGEFSVQSPITINETSLTLSNNVSYENITCKEVVIECYKRCLTYSLYSHWGLCQQVLEEVRGVWERKERVIEILLDLKRMFSGSQPREYLNRIYIDDFCVFVEKVDVKVWEDVKLELGKVEINEKNLDLKLEQ